MTLAELMKLVQSVAPDALFDEGPLGEVLVFTGLAAPADADWESGSDELIPID
jgi:hypothetical protein